MKKNIYLAVLLFLTGCQNELYKNPLDDFQSEQGVYIANNGVLQSFVEEGKDVEIKGLQVALAVQDTKEIKVIDCLNKEFDPNFMEAVLTEKIEGVEKNQVIEVLQKGYMYKDKLLRPAMVKVSE